MPFFRSSTGDVLRNALPLALVLGAVGLAVGASSLYLAYRAELADDREWVAGIAEQEAANLEAVAAFDDEFSQEDHPEGAFGATLSQLQQAYRGAAMWGETVQIHLVALEGNTLTPLLPHRGSGPEAGEPILHSLELEGVLGRAVAGESGSMILPDRPGGGSLVAFRPVHFSEGRILGLAVTMDVAETRAPFLRLGLLIGSATLLLIVLGSLLTRRMARPTLRALEETEDRYRQLFQNSGQAMLITSVGGIVLECNEAASHLLGMPRESMLGHSVVSFYQDPTQRQELLRRLEADGRVRGMELHLSRMDGRDITCLANIYRRPSQKEEEPLLETVLTDITPQKEQEKELRASEARYFDLFAHAPEMLLSVSPGKALIRECNEAVVSQFGFPREEILGRSAFDFCAPESLERVQEIRHLLLETGAVEGVELTLRRKDGSAFVVAVNAVRVRDEAGAIVATRLSLRDLTAQKEAESKLLEQERFLRAIFEGSQSGILVADDHGRYLSANPAAAELLGFPVEDILQMSVGDLQAVQKPGTGERYKKYMETGKETGEFEFTRSDGEKRVAHYQAVRVQKDLNLSVMADITEQKAAEEAFRESEARLRSIYESVHAGIMLQAPDGEILHANSVAEEIFRLPAHEIEGMKSEDSLWKMIDEEGNPVPGRDHPSMITFRTGEPIRDAIRGVLFDDPSLTKWLLINTEPRYSEGMEEVMEVVITFQDITEVRTAQTNLQVERDRAQRYLDVAEVMLLALDGRGRIEMVNRKGCELLEAREEDLLGKDWFDLSVPPDLVPEVRQVFHRLIRGDAESIEYYENPMVTASGATRIMAWHNSVLSSPTGKIRGVFSSGEDITEQLMAQEALRESEERSRALIETSPDHILLLDSELKIEFVNRLAPGLAPEDLIGKHLFLLEEEEDRGRVEEVLRGVLETGEPAEYSTTYRGPSGGVNYFASRVGRFISGGKTGLIVTARDVTMRVEAEAALRESEARFRELFSEMREGMALHEMIWDEDGNPADYRFLDVNPAFEELTGLRKEDLLGRRVKEVLPGTEDSWIQRYGEVVRTGVPTRFEDESAVLGRHYQVSAFRPEEGQFAVTFTDVTLRVIAERERQEHQEHLVLSQERLRALADRLARIREDERTAISRELHDELGQTLTGLRMDLAMERSELPAEMKELKERFEVLIQTTDQNIDLVRELSSRLRPPILDVMGLGPAIQWQVDEYRPRTSIQFRLDLPEDGPDLPDATRIAFFRIAQESLTNVFRHSGAQNVWVTLVEEGGSVMLKVEDDGRGVPPEELERARSLGLLGMRERALGIGGELTIGSRKDGGTTVHVIAPTSHGMTKGGDG